MWVDAAISDINDIAKQLEKAVEDSRVAEEDVDSQYSLFVLQDTVLDQSGTLASLAHSIELAIKGDEKHGGQNT